jgi:hypothetical protein
LKFRFLTLLPEEKKKADAEGENCTLGIGLLYRAGFGKIDSVLVSIRYGNVQNIL